MVISQGEVWRADLRWDVDAAAFVLSPTLERFNRLIKSLQS